MDEKLKKINILQFAPISAYSISAVELFSLCYNVFFLVL